MDMMRKFTKINQSIDEMMYADVEDEDKEETDTLFEKDSRIIDEETKYRIRKHLGSEDLNISGLKQSKHKNSTMSNNSDNTHPVNIIERIHNKPLTRVAKESIVSDV